MNVAELQQLQYFPLAKAFLCNDCQNVHNSNSWCPACSSNAIVPVTKWVAELVTRYAKEGK